MPGPLHVVPSTLQDGGSVPAVSRVTPNTRVKTSMGFVSTISDTVMWPGGVGPLFTITGTWVAGSARIMVNGVPAIDQSSTGITQGVTPAGVPTSGPITITSGDPRTQGG